MLSYTDQIRIYQEVILGVEPSKDESEEAKAYRDKAEKQIAEMKQQGIMPDIPLDWEEDSE